MGGRGRDGPAREFGLWHFNFFLKKEGSGGFGDSLRRLSILKNDEGSSANSMKREPLLDPLDPFLVTG